MYFPVISKGNLKDREMEEITGGVIGAKLNPSDLIARIYAVLK